MGSLYVGKSDFEVPFLFVAMQGDMSFEDLVVYCFSEGCCRDGDRRGGAQFIKQM